MTCWSARAGVEGDRGDHLLVIVRARTFFSSDYLPWGPAPLQPMTLPPKVELQGISQGELLFRISQDWQISGQSFKTGSLLSMPLAAVTSARRRSARSWCPDRATRSNRWRSPTAACSWPCIQM